MKCEKCKWDFPEREIHTSHDVPKYLGGTDAEGRHYLCTNCHDAYEMDVLKLVMMNYIKKNQKEFEQYKWCAKLVKRYFFKEEN